MVPKKVVPGYIAPPTPEQIRASVNPYSGYQRGEPLVGGMKEVDPTEDVNIDSLFSVNVARPPQVPPYPQPAQTLPPQRVVTPQVPEYASETAVGSFRETAVLHSGLEMPKSNFKPGTPPLVMEALNVLETVMCGGVIEVWATRAYDDVSRIVAKIRSEYCVKPGMIATPAKAAPAAIAPAPAKPKPTSSRPAPLAKPLAKPAAGKPKPKPAGAVAVSKR